MFNYPKKGKQGSGYTEFIGEPILFDKYQFPRYPSLTCFADGKSGRRSLFISDKQKSFVISFEEGMKCLDQRDTITDGTVYISSEYQCDGRYIHQLRTDPKYRPGIGNFAFFHMQIPDKHGSVHILPGQIVANNHYQWAEGVEQILIDILKGVSVWKWTTVSNHQISIRNFSRKWKSSFLIKQQRFNDTVIVITQRKHHTNSTNTKFYSSHFQK